jgi:hypothetical protein
MSDLFGSSFLAIFNIWNPTKHQKHCGQTGQTYFVSHHIHGWSASKDARPFSPVFRVVCRGWTGTTSQSWGDTRLGYWPGSVGWDMSGFQKPRNWMKLGHSISFHKMCRHMSWKWVDISPTLAESSDIILLFRLCPFISKPQTALFL